MLLDGTKEEHFSCFLSCSCQLGLRVHNINGQSTVLPLHSYLAWVHSGSRYQKWVYAIISKSFFFRTIEAVNHFDLEPYTEIKEWFEKVKGEIPNYEECNGKGAGDMGLWYRTVTGKGNFISDVNLGWCHENLCTYLFKKKEQNIVQTDMNNL